MRWLLAEDNCALPCQRVPEIVATTPGFAGMSVRVDVCGRWGRTELTAPARQPREQSPAKLNGILSNGTVSLPLLLSSESWPSSPPIGNPFHPHQQEHDAALIIPSVSNLARIANATRCGRALCHKRRRQRGMQQ